MGMEEIGYGGLGIGDPEGTDRMARGSCKLPDHAGLFGYLSTFVGAAAFVVCVCKYGTYVNINFIKQT